MRKIEWVVYAKRPFAGPEAVLAYLSRYTHRVAISNSRLITLDDRGVSFTWKDYRTKGRDRQKVMTLATSEFIRRFLIHTLPQGFHRIRHYGLCSPTAVAPSNIARARRTARSCRPTPQRRRHPSAVTDDTDEPPMPSPSPARHCGGAMIVVETFEPGHPPRAPPPRKADRA